MHRFVQHSGRLYISTIALGELYVWAYQRANPQPIIERIEDDLLADLHVLDFDAQCSNQFGKLRGELLQKGLATSRMDLMIAAVALVHNLVLVTHNTADYANVTGLLLEDWLLP